MQSLVAQERRGLEGGKVGFEAGLLGQSSSMSREQVFVQAKDWPASRIGRKPVHLQNERNEAWGCSIMSVRRLASLQHRDMSFRNRTKGIG